MKQNIAFSARVEEVQRSLFTTSGLGRSSALTSTTTFTLELYFLKHLMDLVHNWYNDRCRSKVLSAISYSGL